MPARILLLLPGLIPPEKTQEKVAKANAYKLARKNGDKIDGLNAWNIRWVGTEGYKGIVARQLQEFKRAQKKRAVKGD